MKTPFSFRLRYVFAFTSLFAFIFVLSCTQDSVIEPAENLTSVNAKSSKGKKATRAWKGKFTNVGDFEIPLVSCFPEEAGFALTTNFISGNMTHLGKIQMGSYGRPQPGTCSLTGPNTADVVFHVNYIGAHGDMITTIEHVSLTVDFEADPNGLTGSFDNTLDENGDRIPITILSGTGRFEGAEGELYFKNAVFTPNPNGPGTVGSWRLEGKITY
ncbi:hypothetical protein [Muriicola soli]|uniref:Uncharacterized protein n=1 Tax=Muriicola soli TaxID=2507538 RepID=A0A411ED19_9FLAO|nr:hypothetical protein [Muriicola soli]QBA65340.1 hypothetical protein EQY75_12845 [Muriicola soli]